MYTDSAYTIDYQTLYASGIRGLLFDIDNTLVKHGAPATKEAVQLFERLHAAGFQTMVLSNNKEGRVKSFCDSVKTQYLYKAGKPKKAGYLKGMRLMGTDRNTTVFIGDQLFTDLWGAKRSGIRTILVKPIDPKEEIQIVLKRIPERLILYFYRRQNKC